MRTSIKNYLFIIYILLNFHISYLGARLCQHLMFFVQFLPMFWEQIQSHFSITRNSTKNG